MYIYHTGQKKVCADMPTAVSHPPWTTKKLNPFPLTSQQGGGSHCPSDTSSENEAISTPGFLMTQYLSGGRKKKRKVCSVHKPQQQVIAAHPSLFQRGGHGPVPWSSRITGEERVQRQPLPAKTKST